MDLLIKDNLVKESSMDKDKLLFKVVASIKVNLSMDYTKVMENLSGLMVISTEDSIKKVKEMVLGLWK